MKNDGKIHIPARRMTYASDNRSVVRLTEEAYNALVDIYNESTLSMMQIASRMILHSVDRVVFDKEE